MSISSLFLTQQRRRAADRRRFLADFDHFKIQLAHATVRAQPVFRDILPERAGGDTFIRPALALVVNQSTDHTLPLLHNYLRRITRLLRQGNYSICAGAPSRRAMNSAPLRPTKVGLCPA